jgi:hypothetical protein
MITANVIHRVFHIKYKDSTGTCFSIDYENKQYIVTAKHVVSGLKNNEFIEINQENVWKTVRVSLVGHSNTADVTVFSIDTIIGILPLPPTNDGMIYGQDAYFLGFPYMINIDTGMNRNFPLPLVKKGIVSIWYKEENNELILIDGHNNPGFSGGPLVFVPPGKPTTQFQVAGIISRYRFQRELIFNSSDEPLEAHYKENTGIIICYNINHAIELIKSNPIGLNININS